MDRLTTSGDGRRRARRDVASGAVLLGVALVYGLWALRIPSVEGEPGPRFMPVLLAALLAAFAAWILGAALAAPPSAKSLVAAPASPASPAPAEARVWLAVVGTAAYAALFPVLGFALSTVAYTLFVTRLFTRRRRVLVTVPILVTLALYVCFRMGLGVRLPPGLLG